jgi:hypothetical protein
MFSVVRVLHKFDFRPVINETRANIGKKVIVTETHVFSRICMFFPRPSSRMIRISTHAVHTNYTLRVNRQYMHHLLQQQIFALCPYSVCGPG